MKIVFWGTPEYAAQNLLSIINSNHEVIAVVTQPDRKRGRGKDLSPSPVKQVALEYGIPVHTTQSISNDKKAKELLFELKADLYIVVAFGQILPKEILDQPLLGCWNSHASLLPKWRGAAPIHWSIINDDSMTGVCIMAMEEGLDTGPVIDHESTEIDDLDNLEILTNRLSKISSKLLIRSINCIENTNGLNKIERLRKLNAVDQSNFPGTPSYARQLKKEDFLIDWNQNARTVIKKILGLFPNAYSFYNGKRIKILEVSLNPNVQENNEIENNINNKQIHAKSPGKVIMIKNKLGIFVMTKDYPILIKKAQLEGKKSTDGYTLSIQSDLNVNNIIGN